MSDTLTDLERQVEGRVADLEFCADHEGQCWEDIDPEEREGFDEEDLAPNGEVSLFDYCLNALDVEVFGKRVGGEWEATHVEVLLTCGGPDVRFTTEESSYVVGRWGSDVVRRYVGSDVGSRIDDLFGGDY